MSLVPSPSTARGDLILQPSFFTSSLFVNPCRADIQRLLERYTNEYLAQANDISNPFNLFKRIWEDEGWLWMHLKVFDARTRETFLKIVCRLFVERLDEAEPLPFRTTALFALYTFYLTQPENTHPPLHALRHAELPLDIYNALRRLPPALAATGDFARLAPYAAHQLAALLSKHALHILPRSGLRPLSPSALPREVFVPDDPAAEHGKGKGKAKAKAPKKKGRPSKREVAKKTRDAVVGLERWLERTAAGSPGMPTHALLANAPAGALANYTSHKAQLLDALLADERGAAGTTSSWSAQTGHGGGRAALERANMAVLNRLRQIDAMAAERGLEVGGEGGEQTGLGRVERVVGELVGGGGTGLLGMVEEGDGI
ncbi:hypothetical protein DENSPDRAFT_776368 [Dentipellis sp. KUC8613]|nr:hypothetical protein DENSPDRAFT_776368 [Dentipellis sp. KUC8613]